jgi:hypothetical protein
MAAQLDVGEQALQAVGVKLPKPKSMHVDIDDIIIVDAENIRHDPALGINTYQLDELKDQVIALGYIREPVALEQIGKEFHMRRGFRRGKVAKLLAGDPKTPQEIVKAMRAIPAMVYQGPLDEQQRLMLLNDQDTKKFLYSEVVNLIFRLFDSGMNWQQVAWVIYRQWADLTGKRDILNDVDSIEGQAAKAKRINTWLKGTIKETFGDGHALSKLVVEALKRQALERDKLIKTARNTPKTTDQKDIVPGPYVYIEQKRVDALEAAKLEDIAADTWNGFEGTGPNFHKLWEEYHAADYGLKPEEPPALKSLTHATLNELSTKTSQSKVVRTAFRHAAGFKDVQWQVLDRQIAEREAMIDKWLRLRKYFSDDSPYTKAFNMAMVGGIEQFTNWLEEHLPEKHKAKAKQTAGEAIEGTEEADKDAANGAKKEKAAKS